jgi:thiamine biosynthesis lipoprotein
MNADIELHCYDPDADRRLNRAERWLYAFEERFSRFRPLSELSRLNAAAGRPFRVSPELFRLVELALYLAKRSGGLFDPTVLRRLEALGYNRSFETMHFRSDPPSPLKERGSGGEVSWPDVRLDAEHRTVYLPPGAGIDLGGAGKGWAVDRLAALLGRTSLVNGGGDVFASGRPEHAPAWLVGVEDPFAPERDLCLLALQDKGVATSSRLRRRWLADGRWLHHLIDPRTGAPSRSDLVQVTVVAPSTLLADYHAKVALLLGAEEGLDYLEREPDAEGLLVREDGTTLQTHGLSRFATTPP